MKEKKQYLKEIEKTAGAVFGAFLYAVGINLFVVPAGLYSGGLLGISQVIRTLLIEHMNISITNVDIAGIIYYILNIPILVVAFKKLGKKLLAKTFVTVSVMSVFMALLPTVSPLENDILAQSVIGAIISGVGIGLVLQMGATGGGMDIVGVMLTKWRKDFSVGKVGLAVNIVLYTICLFLFDTSIVIYSLIYAAVHMVAIDKMHYQNIDVAVNVITKNNCKEMEQEIFDSLNRGLTKWQGRGAYTEQGEEILFIMLSKYEVHHLKDIIHKYDPDAFIVVNEGVHVDGHYLKKL